MDYVTIVSKTVQAVSEKYSDPKRVSEVCWDWSNWICNMYLDWLNNYVTEKNFIYNEIFPVLPEDWESLEQHQAYTIAENLLGLFRSIGNLQPTLTYEQVGEVAIKILKGEI